MHIVICIREQRGQKIFIPIMKAEEDGEPGDTMATFDEFDDAEEFCGQHILCKASDNIIIDTIIGDGIII